MNALVFILARTIKNHIKDILRKPMKLVVWLLVIAALIGFFLLSVFSRSAPEQETADLIWLKGIIFALFAVFAIIAVPKGLSSGDMIFSMSDVNFLCTSPIDPRRILLYGIVQMAKMSMMAGLFILFQSNLICANFNVGYSAVLLVFLGFILCVSFMQIVSLIIYSFTNGKPRRKRWVRFVTVLVFTPLIVSFCVDFIGTGNIMASLETLLHSPFPAWTPVAGWAAQGTISFIAGDFGAGFLFYGLIVFFAVVLIVYILRSNPDYYEDVLVTTETAFEKQRAALEGGINNASLEAVSERKVKVAKTGVGGTGASTLFFKHLRESFRSGRLGLWGIPSFILLAGVIGFSLISRESGLLSVLGTLMGMQIFMIGTGRGLKELYNHYVYMIPASSFSKIIWSNAELMLKNLVESLAMFTAAGLIMGENTFIIIMCILVYIMFTLLLIGINYISMRFVGSGISMGLELMIYMLAIVIAMLPGLAAAFIIAAVVGETSGVVLGLLALAAWEFIAGCLCIAGARGVLHNCDMPVMKTGK